MAMMALCCLQVWNYYASQHKLPEGGNVGREKSAFSPAGEFGFPEAKVVD